MWLISLALFSLPLFRYIVTVDEIVYEKRTNSQPRNHVLCIYGNILKYSGNTGDSVFFLVVVCRRALLPAALASVPFGFVLVRVEGKIGQSGLV